MSDEKTPVTLEGIAAVLAVVPALLGQAPEKARQSALSDALGMLSRACVMAGGKQTLSEDTSISPSLLAENEKRIRAEMAQGMEDAAKAMGDTIRDRLLASLFPGQPAPNLSLEDCLRDVDARLNRNRPPLGNPPPYIVRDAALEEAAVLFDEEARGLRGDHAGEMAERDAARIRALKSKPTPQPSENPGELPKPAPKWEPDSPTDLPDEEQPQPELVPLAVGATDHDFGWALAQMRAGKKVRRGDSSGVFGPIFTALRFSFNDAIVDADGEPATLDHSSLRATDWEVAE